MKRIPFLEERINNRIPAVFERRSGFTGNLIIPD